MNRDRIARRASAASVAGRDVDDSKRTRFATGAMNLTPPRLDRGSPFPLGATLVDGGVNFAVYSEHAESIMLAIFPGDSSEQEVDVLLPARTGFVWHGFLPGASEGLRYGFRARGPFEPDRGLRFDSSKLLLDPYARAITGSVTWNESVFDFDRVHGDISIPNLQDSCGSVPRSVVVDPTFDWEGVQPPGHPLASTIIYECHVKGATKLFLDVPPELRGTYAGLGHPAMVNHLVKLGITAVELLPVHHFVDDEFLVDRGLVNYWGYNSIGFFAPMGRYAAAGDGGGQVREFQEMVRSLHKAGIEVFLDVVYNHTAEGGRKGPTLSFRGLDNTTYYRSPKDSPGDYENFSGTGNTFNTQHPAVVRLVMDSLRYWVDVMHVDGFRFDLASSLGRDSNGFDPWSRLFTAIRQDPALQRVKLIAEPWDVGPDGYQVGHFPTGWSEWNDRFRDTARSFWLGHRSTLGEFALRLTGSADLYDRPGRGPLSTVNFVTCHDGFDLTDLVSYSRKRNESNGEDNNDGNDHNLGYDFGVDGPTSDPTILDARFRAKRNLIATLLLSHGVPMLLGGDELSKTQRGNNNAYAQDNETSWLDWDLDARERDFLDFVRRCVGLRRTYAALRPERYVESERTGPHEPGIADWHDADGSDLQPSTWGRQQPRVLTLTIYPSSAADRSESAVVLVLFNASENDATFRVPVLRQRRRTEWTVVLDTQQPRGESSSVLVSGTDVMIPAGSISIGIAE